MQIQSESRIAYPREQVFAAYRDRLGEIAAYIPDVREIEVVSRENRETEVLLHNVWKGDREIPTLAARFLKPEHLVWDDYATWNSTEFTCAWRIETRAFTDAVSCSGMNRFLDDDEGGTRLVLSGELLIVLEHLPGVPTFLAGRLKPKMEQFIVSLVTPNLRRVNQSLQQFLDENA